MSNQTRFITMLAAVMAVLTAGTGSAQTPALDRRVLFSTYLGGDRSDDAASVAVDSQGHTYVAGQTDSRDFSGRGFGNINLNFAVSKAYLTKYSPDGKRIEWSHIIGGSSNTRANAVAVDRLGNVYLAGTTGARDFPLLRPVQDKNAGLNIAFVMKFDGDGKLLFSTYLGGDRNDEGLALAVDDDFNFYLAGRASSSNFPVKNALQPRMAGGGQDAFIAKFTADYQLAWATYLGGTAGTDNIYAIAVGPDQGVFVTGESMSPGMASESAWIRLPVSYSSFAAKLSPAGDAVAWFTYIGHRSGYTKAQALAVDAQGRAWIGGHTNAKAWPMSSNAWQPEFAGGFRDGFLLRLSAAGDTAEYLTFVGGSYKGETDPDDSVEAVAVDHRGFVTATGFTASPDFVAHRALQAYPAGGFETFLLRLNPEETQMIVSTLWGGSKRDASTAIALGPGQSITVVGQTYSDNMPLKDAVRPRLGASTDAFVTRFCDPWLSAYPASSLDFGYTTGGDRPATQKIEILTGCPVGFEWEEVAADQPWVRLRLEGRTAPFELTVEVLPDGLEPGEYAANIRVTVPEAFHPVLTIPVRFVVAEPAAGAQP